MPTTEQLAEMSIDEFAVLVEQTIQRWDEKIDNLPDFEPRSAGGQRPRVFGTRMTRPRTNARGRQ